MKEREDMASNSYAGGGEGRGSQRGEGHCLLGREGCSLSERDWKGPKRREKPLEKPGRCSSSLHEGSRERTTRSLCGHRAAAPRTLDKQAFSI